eukprot:GHVS01058457.1.p2 GENE.GHVS01058457.1~~GHVS01058457.1.p2  ORF type:complete len:167 (-),score=11.91 GHVS01058457.1:1337-1837(-)
MRVASEEGLAAAIKTLKRLTHVCSRGHKHTDHKHPCGGRCGLQLNVSGVRQIGRYALQEIVRKCRQLERVVLNGCIRVSDEGVKQLAAAEHLSHVSLAGYSNQHELSAPRSTMCYINGMIVSDTIMVPNTVHVTDIRPMLRSTFVRLYTFARLCTFVPYGRNKPCA